MSTTKKSVRMNSNKPQGQTKQVNAEGQIKNKNKGQEKS